MKTEKEIKEKVDALARDLENDHGIPMDIITKYFKKGAKTFGDWVLENH